MSTISAGTSPSTALVNSGDTTGQLVLQTNGTTTAVTIGTNQVVTLAQPLPVASGGTGATSLAAAGILTTGAAVTVAQGGTGSTSLTANNVLLGNGTSAIQTVAPGSSGNILTSNGTTWTSAAPAGSSPWVLISTVDASSSSTLDFTSGISSTYRMYILVFTNLTPTTNCTIQVVASTNGGSSYITTGYNRAGVEFRTDSSSPPSYYYQTGRPGIEINGTSVQSSGNNAGSPGVSGFVYIYGPSTTKEKTFFVETTYNGSNASAGYAASYQSPVGSTNTTLSSNAINAFQVQLTAGVFGTGRVSLYGLST